ncbi:MAG: BatD family protein [Candidatus Thiodiazotropha sp. (ex Epidulcina cf. delphinae)]|nr:BatD family protein [Candidatus Thiodiazotropha sp. (ex Epidulcina cf. delphinae)]
MSKIRSVPATSSTGLLILCLLLISAPLHAKVAAILSSNSTSLEQPVRLTLQMEGEQEISPDLSGLDKDFEILGRSSQQSISVINGRMSAKRSLSLTLLPKRAGALDIPPIKIGNASTQALTLQVSAQPRDEPPSDTRHAIVELSLNKSRAYIEEEIILTLKLFQAHGVRGESLEEPRPSTPDTQMKLLHEERYNSQRDGTDYRVLERRYALYAYQSGGLEIGGAKFRGRSGKDSFFSLFNDPFSAPQQTARIVRSESNSVKLEVLPIPEAFTGERWLPARNLQVVESGIDGQAPLIAGKPLLRRIMVFADGLLSGQLPAIEPDLPDGIKQYPERPQLNDTPARNGNSGSRQSAVTLIATEAGRYHLPALEIPWWNTGTDRQEIARLPALQIEMLPNPDQAAAPLQAAPSPLSAAEPTAEDSENETIASSEPPTPVATIHDNLWLVWLFAIAWVATLFAWWFSHRRDRAHQQEPAVRPAQGGPDRQAVNEALERLRQAYTDENAAAARSAWLDWAQLKWPENPPNNLTRLAKRCDEAVSQAVNSLERALYSPSEEHGWTGFDVVALIGTMEEAPIQEKQPEQLIPLNP